jgi:excisionase family DNA binding protein
MSPFDAWAEDLLERIRRIVREEVAGASGPYWDEPIGVEEAAKFLKCTDKHGNISPKRIYNLSSEGRIPVLREGGRLLFTRRLLHEWLTSGKAAA